MQFCEALLHTDCSGVLFKRLLLHCVAAVALYGDYMGQLLRLYGDYMGKRSEPDQCFIIHGLLFASCVCMCCGRVGIWNYFLRWRVERFTVNSNSKREEDLSPCFEESLSLQLRVVDCECVIVGCASQFRFGLLLIFFFAIRSVYLNAFSVRHCARSCAEDFLLCRINGKTEHGLQFRIVVRRRVLWHALARGCIDDFGGCVIWIGFRFVEGDAHGIYIYICVSCE